MPNLLRIFIILIILTLAAHSHARDVISGKVVGVSDDDTITVLENRIQYKIRLYGIDDWRPVYGELLTFDEPENRLPAIDRLEGFYPCGPCLYRRVLVAVRTKGTVLPAWLYVIDTTGHRGFMPLPSGKWRS